MHRQERRQPRSRYGIQPQSLQLQNAVTASALPASPAYAAPTDDGYFNCEGDMPYWRLKAALKLLVCA